MTALLEGIGIALESIRANKARAALTILGVAIGVMVVVVIASVVRGINAGVTDIVEQLGPKTFYVLREFQEGIQISDGRRRRTRPRLTMQEARHLEDVPTVGFVVVNEQTSRSVSFGDRSLSSVTVEGRGEKWTKVSGGDVFPGRSYTPLEEQANATVAVVNKKLAEELFGQLDPIDKRIRIGGVRFTVIGVFNPPPDIFGEGNEPRAIVPHGTFAKHVRQFRSMYFMLAPTEEATVAQAIEDVTAALRSARGLRPGEDNNFDVVTQDKLLANWNRVTGIFFGVMIALSGVGLMVGGVGVVAIMMISVTERTREIGVRKALGARKREILWQFLVESATLTLVGGMIGMGGGALITLVVKAVLPLPAQIPLWSVVAALAAAVFTGIGFGLYPAWRAAWLDPVEALRYE